MRYVLLVFFCALANCLADDVGDNLPWWKTAVLYQVYPRSFKDSDGDGIGDLKGITEQAEYFREIGVDSVWLSPIYKSPMYDLGYDIMDFTDIDPLFGTMEDFERLSATLKEKGIKLLLDFVPNHSSYKHAWFQSALNISDPFHEDYKDFYIWREPSGWNGNTPIPPNNWISTFDSSAWCWSEERQLFYFHQFMPQQPDLNYRNPNVVGNMTKILDFWMDKGVMGFRMDAPMFIYENNSFLDEPPLPGTNGSTYATQQHIYIENQPETFELLRNWTEFVRKRNVKDKVERPILMEVYDPLLPLQALTQYYGTGEDSLAIPFNFNLMGVDQESRSSKFKDLIMSWMDAMPKDGVSSWVIGNHDQIRVADKCGPEMVDAMNLLSGVLPGIKVTYNGEELGMQNVYLRDDEEVDHTIYHRDRERSPMQWDDSDNAGFSNNSSTWVPVNPNYWWLNVAAQRSAQSSHLKVFQAMAKARKDPVLQRGNLTVLTPDNDTLVVVRYYNASYFALIINLGSHSRSFTSQNLFIPNKIDMDMSVVIGSVNSGLKTGEVVRQASINVHLRPKAAVLLRSWSSASISLPQMSFLISFMLVVSLLKGKLYL